MKNEAHEVTTGVTSIELDDGQHTLVDTVDYPKVEPYYWSALWVPEKKTYYAVTPIRLANGDAAFLPMHILLVCGFPEGAVVDVPN
jgi:hypothetical protein